MDVLTDVLDTLELKGWLSSRMEVTPSWRFEFTPSQDMIFHILKFTGGYLFVEGEPVPLRITDGDVILLPHGHAHTLCDELTAPLKQAIYLSYEAQHKRQFFAAEGEVPKMVMLCGAFHAEHPGTSLMLNCLPKVIHIPGELGRAQHDFNDIVQFIARESTSNQSGSEVMLRRLTEMLFIQVIRVWIDQQTDASSGWIAALRDQPISTALGLIHQSPERGWKVEELADAVALSRSAFSARFTHLVGEPPMKYLTRWRMHKATDWLKHGVKMEKIAQLLGYDSEVAFRKAFKREVGMPPARYRKSG